MDIENLRWESEIVFYFIKGKLFLEFEENFENYSFWGLLKN